MIDIAVLIVISVITLIFAWTSKELNRKEESSCLSYMLPIWYISVSGKAVISL